MVADTGGTIRSRLTLAMILALIPLILGFGVEVADRHASRRQLVISKQEQEARFIAAFVKAWLDNSLVLGATVSANPPKWPSSASAYDGLVTVINGLKAVMFVDRDGHLHGGYREPVSKANAAEIVRTAARSRRTSRSATLSVFGPDGTCHLLVFYPLVGPNEQVLITEVDMGGLAVNLKDMAQHATERFVIADTSNRVLLSTDPSVSVGGHLPRDLSAVTHRGSGAGYYQGGQRLSAIAAVPGWKWAAYVTMPTWEVMSPIYWGALRDLATCILAIIAAILLAGVLAARMARPIQDLETMAMDIGRGEFRPPGPATDITELQNLSRVFQEMATATSTLLSRQAERNELLEEQAQQLRAASERLVNAQEDERRRLAGGIHDWINQHLTSLFYHLQSPKLRDRPETEAICARLDMANLELRRIMTDLHPHLLSGEGLLATCRSHVADYEKRTGIRCRLSLEVDELRLDGQVQLMLFRILQEALANAEKHSGASDIMVSIADQDDEVALVVSDNGKGFAQAHQGRGLGLLSMRERALALGGRLAVESVPGAGTRIEVVAPRRRQSDGESPNPTT